MSECRISKWVEFDAGHRVPTHNGMCRNLHGHRYRVEAEVVGQVPNSGMVIDFGILGSLLKRLVHDRWDHTFIAPAADIGLIDFLRINNYAHDIIDCPPTAENLARIVAESLKDELPSDLRLTRVTVRETPTSSAVWES